eukprot:CAMPEP_0197920304 /NCGR_PEP_ID=MMETSP1439-20131203/88742_1 /TAXON_ID=66791 /ORGANISM="Gonyaulax spinifera, Strain CCMP409" /LENGTH=36 /DNA_ID= /DNA_START= /DNA_END= /DNA_ORIENTATION=
MVAPLGPPGLQIEGLAPTVAHAVKQARRSSLGVAMM